MPIKERIGIRSGVVIQISAKQELAQNELVPMSDSGSQRLDRLPLVTEASPPEELQGLLVGRVKELTSLQHHFQRKQPQQAVIVGQRGEGKTALAYMFREQAKRSNLFPAGWQSVHATPFTRIVPSFFGDALKAARKQERSILFVDDYNVGSDTFRSALWAYLAQNPRQDLLICTDRKVPKEMRDPLVLRLGGLNHAEFLELLRRRLKFSGIDEADASELFRSVAGRPLYGDLAAKTIREKLLTLQEFVHGLQSFSRSGILGPDGKPLRHVPDPFRLVVVDTNQILLEHLRAHPGDLHVLDPRKFEELVAQILGGRGYDITLTPPSKDGGFDMFAARKDDLGSFLYLVECKRYTPPQKVGVSVVRALHGVVQQRQANAGIVITSSFFTKGAREFQQNVPHQMQLRDYLALQKWLGVI